MAQAPMDRRLLLVRDVFLVGHAQALRYIYAPHCIRLYGVDSVMQAPEYSTVLRKIAEGWRVGDSGLAPLLLVVRLHDRLRTIRSNILPALIVDPLDTDAYRRLRAHGDAIRHIGPNRFATPELRVLAVKLGNRLKNVAVKMMSGRRPAAWFIQRRRSLYLHTRQLLRRQYIPLL
ncbi:LOW QUALITY PROTEIN: hypothetical protein BRADI_1g35852v3 [Brachypodium distachyon]|uniref:Uncharacterized protein n=1 Tax=Brachypodium distachyon TaxID=15368 RepID=A0A2K2DMY1_BRADI|nr:LOW QUALITY PROTEIN: hypothetical protein BRADI_1g35852v3 [Brachypodium distachyon]